MPLDLNEPIIINFDYIGNKIRITTKPIAECAPAMNKHRAQLQPKKGYGGGPLKIQSANSNLFAAVVAEIEGVNGLTKQPGTQGWWKPLPPAIINTTCDRLMSTDDDFDAEPETDEDGEMTEQTHQD